MSLNKTLDRLFDEIRREAKRNPAFADRLDAVLRGHESRRDVPDEVMAELAAEEPPALTEPKAPSKPKAKAPPAPQETPPINPAGLFKREGEDALTEALASLNLAALQALVGEHNLDPSGVTGAMDGAELIAHIVAQAKKRAERDEKMFDY
ncbi:MAG: hypothetical protein NVV62_06370 [Terricaulis sp.]|nr:hypothetical protein [Terricaulis sp.]